MLFMASRSERWEMARTEAGVKLVLFGVIALALLVGGFSGFATTLKAIVVLIIVVAGVALLCLLIAKSRLAPRKKLGFSLILVAMLTAWLWSVMRAPRQWPEQRATVTAVGSGTATLRIGTGLFPTIFNVTGPNVARFTVGTSVPVWIDPVSQAKLSLQPRATEGGQRYWMLALASVLGFGGLYSLAIGKRSVTVGIPRTLPGTAGSNLSSHPSTTERLAAIDWYQFETVTARILEAEGWTVKARGGANPDGGADLFAIRDGRKAVIQCKHWRRVMIQPKIIRELLGTKASTQFMADDAILFTLGDCTEAALACARENSVIIRGAQEIGLAIDRLGIGLFPELTNPDKKLCPKCGASMVLRTNAPNPFWGCSTYPRCRGVIERA